MSLTPEIPKGKGSLWDTSRVKLAGGLHQIEYHGWMGIQFYLCVTPLLFIRRVEELLCFCVSCCLNV